MIVEHYGPGGAGAARSVASRVVLYDANNNPIFVAVEYEPGQIVAASIDDPEGHFEELLSSLGIRSARVKVRLHNE
jgi:hypothetical protein